jgi:hypothetical protein
MVLNPALRAFRGSVSRTLFSIAVSVPERPGDVARRHWNRFCREAMQECLQTHHRERIPLHFRQDARYRYGYKDRTARYRAAKRKRYKSTRDLVKTGASERRMKREGQIIVGGAAEGSKRPISGKLRLMFDFTQTAAFEFSQMKRFKQAGRGWYDSAAGRRAAGVTIADMHREVQQMTPQERRAFAEQYVAAIMRRYRSWQGARKRKRLPGQ